MGCQFYSGRSLCVSISSPPDRVVVVTVVVGDVDLAVAGSAARAAMDLPQRLVHLKMFISSINQSINDFRQRIGG